MSASIEEDFIVVDVGNTTTKVSTFLNGILDRKVTFLTKDILQKLNSNVDVIVTEKIKKIGFCSVAPGISLVKFPFLTSRFTHCLEVNSKLALPFSSSYSPITSLGNDRIALISYAYHYMVDSGEDRIIIVSAGTATTIDVITKEKGHLGGLILPGVTTSFHSLLEKTQTLPSVSFIKKPSLLGNSTVGALQSGWYWGFVEQVFGIILRIEKKTNAKFPVIVAGGYGSILIGCTERMCIFEQDAVLKGVKNLMVNNGVLSKKNEKAFE